MEAFSLCMTVGTTQKWNVVALTGQRGLLLHVVVSEALSSNTTSFPLTMIFLSSCRPPSCLKKSRLFNLSHGQVENVHLLKNPSSKIDLTFLVL